MKSSNEGNKHREHIIIVREEAGNEEATKSAFGHRLYKYSVAALQ